MEGNPGLLRVTWLLHFAAYSFLLWAESLCSSPSVVSHSLASPASCGLHSHLGFPITASHNGLSQPPSLPLNYFMQGLPATHCLA